MIVLSIRRWLSASTADVDVGSGIEQQHDEVLITFPMMHV
jgi:hypothetical protein